MLDSCEPGPDSTPLTWQVSDYSKPTSSASSHCWTPVYQGGREGGSPLLVSNDAHGAAPLWRPSLAPSLSPALVFSLSKLTLSALPSCPATPSAEERASGRGAAGGGRRGAEGGRGEAGVQAGCQVFFSDITLDACPTRPLSLQLSDCGRQVLAACSTH